MGEPDFRLQSLPCMHHPILCANMCARYGSDCRLADVQTGGEKLCIQYFFTWILAQMLIFKTEVPPLSTFFSNTL